jgi:hypothetical protein
MMNFRYAQPLALAVLTLLLLLAAFSRSEAAEPSAANVKTLDRNLEPVVLNGSDVGSFTGAAVGDIFVYAYTNSQWISISMQIDPVTDQGAYTSTEDGVLDVNDEIVFMAKDTGEQAPAGTRLSEVLPVSTAWYEVEITDPTATTKKGWAYIVRSATLNPTPKTDYVDYDAGTARITGQSYALGFDNGKLWADYLTLGAGQDILDRSKARVLCTLPTCPLTEEDLPITVPTTALRDGDVRIIVRGGRVVGYGSMISWATTLPLNLVPQGDVHLTLDFSLAASSGKLYNVAAPAGVTVDGVADNVPATPFSPWMQLSTADGTLIQVADRDELGGTLSNFYEDDSTTDPDDTGDQLRYGEIGTIIAAAGRPSQLNYDFSLYALPGNQPNQGAQYNQYYLNPLTVLATRFSDVNETFTFLPALSSGAAE